MSILSPSASTTAHQLAAVAAAASAMTSLDQVSSQFMPKCPLCDKTFANTSNLKHHMNTIHFNEAKWICNECGKVCTSKSNLKVHLRVHLRVKPYYCRWCDYNCMHHSSIRDHLSKCHPEKAHNSCEPGYIFNSAAVPEPELSTFESTYGSTFKALEEEAAAAAAAAAVAHANNNCEKQLLSNKIDSGNFDADDGMRGDELCRNKQFQAVSSFKFKKKLLKKHQQQFNLKRKFMSYSMSTSASSYPDACGNANNNNNNHDDAENSDDNNLIDCSDDNNNNNGGEMVNDDDGNVYMPDSYQTYREEDTDETYENGGSVGKKLNSSFSNLDVQNLNSYYKNNNTNNSNTESSNNLNKAANLIMASNALLQGGSQNNSNGNNNMNLNSLAATFLQQLTNSAAYGIFQQYNLLSASPSSLVANLQSMAALQQQQQQQQAQQQQQHNQQASTFAATASTIKKVPLKFTNSKGSSILSDSASSGTQGSTNKTMEELNSPSSSSSSASSPPPLSPAGSSTYSSSASSSTTSVNQGLVKNGGGLMLLKNATVKLNQKAISEVIKRLNGSKELLPTGNEVKKEDESSGSSSSSGVHGDDYDDVGDNENEMNNATHVTSSDTNTVTTTNGATDEVDMMMMMRGGDANCEEPELVPGDDSTSATSYKCKFCNIIFNEYSLYSIHAGMHADGANPWKCKVCGHVCTNKVDFSVHILHLSKI